MYLKKLPLLLLAAASLLLSSSFKKQPMTANEIASFSISLKVKDIAASKQFYEKLGFEQIPGAGGVDQKWMVMKNGAAKVGLFQGMFPQNTITINPTDARSIYKTLTETGIDITFTNGMDNEKGPASFALVDPDGNPILFDQHQ